MKKVLTFIVDKKYSNKDIATFLLAKNISHGCISALKREKDGILVNDKLQFTNYLLKENDVVKISLTEKNDYSLIVPKKLDFIKVYEDEDIIVINKPYNMSVHPSFKYFEDSLENGLAYYFLEKKEDVVCHFINRLDKDTTGLVLIAKNRFAANILSQDVKNNKIERKYLALVEKEIKIKKAVIEAPIAREKPESIIRTVDFENGKPAITKYKVLNYNKKHNVSLIELELLTGKTHQIRVHMKYIGHPLVGDKLYNKTNTQLNRQALHSYFLRFKHPFNDEILEFKLQLPLDFKKLVDKCYN